MRQKKNGNRRIWKWLFLTLLAMNLGLGLVLVARLISPREETRLIQIKQDGDPKIGTFSTSRDQLNETVSTYLQDYQTKDFSYKVYATKQLVLFEGSYTILGATIPLSIYFQPSKLEDGSILLTVAEISAGTLSLPRTDVLNYLKKSYKLPEFVTVDVESSTILIQLPAIENQLNIYVKANTIDLYNDTILFDIYRKK